MTPSATTMPAYATDPGITAAQRAITADPRFQELVSKRNSLATVLSVVMMAIYLTFILLVAFNKPLLATKISGTTSLGILLGLLVIISAIVLTGLYVARANGRFDDLTAELTRDHGRGIR